MLKNVYARERLKLYYGFCHHLGKICGRKKIEEQEWRVGRRRSVAAPSSSSTSLQRANVWRRQGSQRCIRLERSETHARRSGRIWCGKGCYFWRLRFPFLSLSLSLLSLVYSRRISSRAFSMSCFTLNWHTWIPTIERVRPPWSIQTQIYRTIFVLFSFNYCISTSSMSFNKR